MIHDRSPFPDEFDYNHSMGAYQLHGERNIKKRNPYISVWKKTIFMSNSYLRAQHGRHVYGRIQVF